MSPELEQRIAHIESLKDAHLALAMEMLKADGGTMYSLDMLAAAAIKRSMAQCVGFASLMRDKNYVCAASLLRLQLDSCMRFFAAFIVKEPHEFASQVLHGTPIRKLKDQNGKFMTDKHLVDLLGKKYTWMPRVYESTSGFIHLSQKHIFTVFQDWKGNGKFSVRIGADDRDIPGELWIELADGFLAATDALFEYLKGWTLTKKHPELASQVRKHER